VRQFTDAPILLFAPANAPDDTLSVLQAGADMLLPPDVDPAIIVGYIGALLRRWRDGAAGPAPAPTPLAGYQDAFLEVDFVRRSVKVDGRLIRLTPTEFRFLAVLVRHAGELLTYEQILSAVWGWKSSENRVVHTFAAQVRAKLGERAARYIVNEYGSGYRFSPLSA
jgi:two-component system KDP operon response regulator KdpE